MFFGVRHRSQWFGAVRSGSRFLKRKNFLEKSVFVAI
jgi:hypothetical protein